MAGHGYDKTIKMMMNDFCKENHLKADAQVTSDQILNWFRQKYPKVKESTISPSSSFFCSVRLKFAKK